MENYSHQEIRDYLDKVQYRLRRAGPMSYLERGDREAAASAWQDLYQEHPHDYYIAHNLAILFHRWALELEEARDYRQADEHWSNALTYWRQVWQANPFWEELVDRGGRLGRDFKAERLEPFRQELPRLLLEINREYAETYLRRNHTRQAKRHVDYIRGSGFPQSVIRGIRDELADPYLRKSQNYLEKGKLEEAAQTIVRFLKADPEHAQARQKAVQSYFAWGVRLGNIRKWTDAIETLKQALQYAEEPTFRGDIYYNLAIIDQNIGNYASYERNKKLALKENPQGKYHWSR